MIIYTNYERFHYLHSVKSRKTVSVLATWRDFRARKHTHTCTRTTIPRRPPTIRYSIFPLVFTFNPCVCVSKSCECVSEGPFRQPSYLILHTIICIFFVRMCAKFSIANYNSWQKKGGYTSFEKWIGPTMSFCTCKFLVFIQSQENSCKL